ncbi:MAG: methyltransferase domain-containing protein [Phycisphaerae bacterium]|nr:methyltransferase domain-containing protein [Phycisphaerae bacterium]
MSESIVETVKSRYGAVAESELSNRDAGVRAVAEAFGYAATELQAIPAEANMGLSCGNPTAMASLKPGEVVVDLGCGGGLDVFLAAAKVGPQGKAIGIDMTPAMIERARKSAARGPDGRPYANVEFILASMDRTTLPSGSVDCVISNCVINLAVDKAAVFGEIARILKAGGRLAISDIALKKNLPAELADNIGAYVGCIAGALLVGDYQRQLSNAGFEQVAVIDSGADLNTYAKVEGQGCCAPPGNDPAGPERTALRSKGDERLRVMNVGCCDQQAAPPVAGLERPLHAVMRDLLARYNINDYAASVKVFAIKP